MPTANVVDYSFARPSLPRVHAAGIEACMRYLSWPGNPKNLTDQERAAIHAHDMAVGLNWESQSGRPLLGADAGRIDGAQAAKMARQLGQPGGRVIVFSCDTDAPARSLPAVLDYLIAAGLQVGAAGYKFEASLYGSFSVIEYIGWHLGVYGWQTCAWSYGRLSQWACLYQFSNGHTLGGGAVDYNVIINAGKFHVWHPELPPVQSPLPVPTPAPAPTPTPAPAPVPRPIPKPPVHKPVKLPSNATYTVLAGDTLSTIAARHSTTVAALVKINRISDPNMIRVGQVLKLSAGILHKAKTPPPSHVYLVKPGDSLSEIANAVHLTVKALSTRNGIKDPNKIYPGQAIHY